MEKIDRIENNKFGKIWVAEDFVSFSQLIKQMTYMYEYPRYWRGQSRIEWRIEPGATRRMKAFPDSGLHGVAKSYPVYPPNIDVIEDIEQSVAYYEKQLLSSARQAGYGFQEGRNLSDLEILALIQHHGGATRLLDFTHNIFIALWFACQDERYIDEPGLLVGLNAQFINVSYKLSTNPIEDILIVHPDTCWTWQPSYMLPRMLAQQSVFVFSACYDNPQTTLPPDIAKIKENGTSESLICIQIPPSLKKDMKSLWRFNFNYSINTLFPDIVGFSMFNSSNSPIDEEMIWKDIGS